MSNAFCNGLMSRGIIGESAKMVKVALVVDLKKISGLVQISGSRGNFKISKK